MPSPSGDVSLFFAPQPCVLRFCSPSLGSSGGCLLQAFRGVGVLVLPVLCTGGGLFSVSFSQASRGFLILVCGERRVLEDIQWRCCSKLDLVNSAGFPSTRSLLLRSSAFSDHDGCLLSSCGAFLFGTCPARAEDFSFISRACLPQLAFPTSEGVNLVSGRSYVVQGASGEGACSTRADSGGFFPKLVLWVSVCVVCIFFLVSQSTVMIVA